MYGRIQFFHLPFGVIIGKGQTVRTSLVLTNFRGYKNIPKTIGMNQNAEFGFVDEAARLPCPPTFHHLIRLIWTA